MMVQTLRNNLTGYFERFEMMSEQTQAPNWFWKMAATLLGGIFLVVVMASYNIGQFQATTAAYMEADAERFYIHLEREEKQIAKIDRGLLRLYEGIESNSRYGIEFKAMQDSNRARLLRLEEKLDR